GRYFKYGNTPPLLPAPTPEQQAELKALDASIHAFARALENEREAIAGGVESWQPPAGLAWAFDERLTASKDFEGDANGAPGKIGHAGVFDGERFEDLGEVAE